MIMFELGPDFLLAEEIPLGAEDLCYGLQHGFLKATTAIDIAVHNVRCAADDPVLQELSALLGDEVDMVPQVLSALDDPERVHDPRESKRKWLYLQLKAAYIDRARLRDPLGVVEQIYADFDYPPNVAPFVRYMPVRPGDASGLEALIRRWSDFVDNEREALRGLSRKPQ
jgi:hypothetical protein